MTVTNALGYKWNTTDNYATATDMSSQTSKTETGLSCGNTYTRYVWSYSSCGTIASPTVLIQATSPLPPAPDPGTHTTSWTQIVWRWNSVANATGYKWNTANNYGTATDMDTATSKVETGLSVGTPYTRYVWSYSICGNVAAPTILTAQTTAIPNCSQPLTDSRNGKIYNTVLIG